MTFAEEATRVRVRSHKVPSTATTVGGAAWAGTGPDRAVVMTANDVATLMRNRTCADNGLRTENHYHYGEMLCHDKNF